jgi:hypothetical protein
VIWQGTIAALVAGALTVVRKPGGGAGPDLRARQLSDDYALDG